MTSKLTLSKFIPTEQLTNYLNLGWEQLDRADHHDGFTDIRKIMLTGSNVDDRANLEWTVPRYIQRGTIRRPLGQYQDTPLSAAVSLDYMGSAEFEFGALPKSLRCMEAQWSLYQLYTADNVVGYRDGKTFSLRLYANFDTEDQYSAYLDYVVQMAQGLLDLKEPTYLKFENGAVTIPDNFDFWWDICNNVIMSFDKQFMSRIINHVQYSLQTLNNNAQNAGA